MFYSALADLFTIQIERRRKNIRRIVEVTGAEIDINEDNSGRVAIYAELDEARGPLP